MIIDIDFPDSSHTLCIFRLSAFLLSDLWRPFVLETSQKRESSDLLEKYMYKHFLKEPSE